MMLLYYKNDGLYLYHDIPGLTVKLQMLHNWLVGYLMCLSSVLCR